MSVLRLKSLSANVCIISVPPYRSDCKCEMDCCEELQTRECGRLVYINLIYINLDFNYLLKIVNDGHVYDTKILP